MFKIKIEICAKEKDVPQIVKSYPSQELKSVAVCAREKGNEMSKRGQLSKLSLFFYHHLLSHQVGRSKRRILLGRRDAHILSGQRLRIIRSKSQPLHSK